MTEACQTLNADNMLYLMLQSDIKGFRLVESSKRRTSNEIIYLPTCLPQRAGISNISTGAGEAIINGRKNHTTATELFLVVEIVFFFSLDDTTISRIPVDSICCDFISATIPWMKGSWRQDISGLD